MIYGPRSDLSSQLLRELYDYNPKTGKFYRGAGSGFGKEVGTPQTRGYLKITIRGVHYLAHRLAWLYVHGVWPSKVIDHINGITSDNRIDNLRDVSHQQNSRNLASHRERAASNPIGQHEVSSC